MAGDDGRLVGGRYRLRTPLGRGGMGVVWRAADTVLQREVAIKEVRATAVADPSGTRLTRSGVLVGSPEYLAPERIGDRPATAASDVWSLGATLFTMVEGYGPFKRDSLMATLGAISTTTAPEAAHAGPLRPVIAAMLSREPSGRPIVFTAKHRYDLRIWATDTG